MNKSEVTIAVDGSLFRYHPRLQFILEATLGNLINRLNTVTFFLSFKILFAGFSKIFSNFETKFIYILPYLLRAYQK